MLSLALETAWYISLNFLTTLALAANTTTGPEANTLFKANRKRARLWLSLNVRQLNTELKTAALPVPVVPPPPSPHSSPKQSPPICTDRPENIRRVLAWNARLECLRNVLDHRLDQVQS
ncbi:hypothetical protein J6590_015207 [Homalodisca vitripennis]|nr:hypothetical protein J6590_015207 [Homalodisca vitripennis]